MYSFSTFTNLSNTTINSFKHDTVSCIKKLKVVNPAKARILWSMNNSYSNPLLPKTRNIYSIAKISF